MFKLLAVTSFTVFFPRSETSEPKITMLELDVEQLENEDGEIKGPVWPSALPVDGIFVAYDASNLHSFRHVRELISKEAISRPMWLVSDEAPFQRGTTTFASRPWS